MLAYLIHMVFLLYTMLIFVRIVGSWFPGLQGKGFMIFISRFTDPYLNTFRRLIPPIGGRLDLSPLLGYFVLQLTEKFLLGFFR
jgi:YggT family protein